MKIKTIDSAPATANEAEVASLRPIELPATVVNFIRLHHFQSNKIEFKFAMIKTVQVATTNIQKQKGF